MRHILITWIERVGSFMRGGGMRRCIVLGWDFLRMRVRFIGESRPLFYVLYLEESDANVLD